MHSGGLDVLAYLPVPLQSHLRVVLGPRSACALSAVDRWEPFVAAARTEASDVLVIDPCADGSSRAGEIAALLDSQPATPVVLYTAMSQPACRAIADLVGSRRSQVSYPVVLHRYDDEPQRFFDMLERQPGSLLSGALIDRLAPALGALPPGLARAIQRLLRRPLEFETVADLAAAAQLTVRTTYRHLAGAGLVSPRGLLVAGRLLRAYAYAGVPGQSLAEIASRVGYSAPRVLTKHMQAVAGVTPRTARRDLRPAEFVDAVARWLYPAPPLAVTATVTATVTAAAGPPDVRRAAPARASILRLVTA